MRVYNNILYIFKKIITTTPENLINLNKRVRIRKKKKQTNICIQVLNI